MATVEYTTCDLCGEKMPTRHGITITKSIQFWGKLPIAVNSASYDACDECLTKVSDFVEDMVYATKNKL